MLQLVPEHKLYQTITQNCTRI